MKTIFIVLIAIFSAFANATVIGSLTTTEIDINLYGLLQAKPHTLTLNVTDTGEITFAELVIPSISFDEIYTGSPVAFTRPPYPNTFLSGPMQMVDATSQTSGYVMQISLSDYGFNGTFDAAFYSTKYQNATFYLFENMAGFQSKNMIGNGGGGQTTWGAPVPEPSSAALALLGLPMLVIGLRKRKQQRQQ